MKGKKIITAIVQRGYQLYHIRCEVSPRLTKKILRRRLSNFDKGGKRPRPEEKYFLETASQPKHR